MSEVKNKLILSKNTIPAPTGTGYETYKQQITDPKTGEVKVIENKVHIYGIIQAAVKTCDMNYIFNAIAKGDKSVLEQTKGVYLDCTDLPTDIHEAQELKNQAISLYNLNPELKELFKTADDYEKALYKGENIANMIIDLRIKKLQKQKEVSSSSVETPKGDK